MGPSLFKRESLYSRFAPRRRALSKVSRALTRCGECAHPDDRLSIQLCNKQTAPDSARVYATCDSVVNVENQSNRGRGLRARERERGGGEGYKAKSNTGVRVLHRRAPRSSFIRTHCTVQAMIYFALHDGLRTCSPRFHRLGLEDRALTASELCRDALPVVGSACCEYESQEPSTVYLLGAKQDLPVRVVSMMSSSMR